MRKGLSVGTTALSQRCARRDQCHKRHVWPQDGAEAAGTPTAPRASFQLHFTSLLLPKKQTLNIQCQLARDGFASVFRARWSPLPQDTNLTALLLFQYRTVLVPVVKSPGFPKIPGKSLSFIYFAPDDENPEIHRPVFLELTPSPEMTYRTLPGTSNEMNVLGIVIFSATIGTCSVENGAL